MRFAYIDSQGNEVEIPSEDALRLRVELGAIVADTSFYDGSADRWGPAGDHDLFRRLKRDLSRPPRPDAGPPRGIGGLRPDPAASSLGRPAARPPASDDPLPAPGHDAASFEAFVDRGHRPEPALPDVDVPFVEPGVLDPSAGASPLPDAGDDEPFDFAGFGALELRDELPVAPRASAPPPDNPERSWDGPAPTSPVEPQADPWTVPGREPWPPEPSSFAAPPGPPPAPRDPLGGAHDETPEWLRNDPEFAEAPEDEPAFPTRDEIRERQTSQQADEAPGTRGPSREAAPSRRTAPRGPSRWPRIAALAGLVAVVGGGAFWFLGGGSGAAEAETTAVELPPLAPSLEPVLREAASAALAATVQELAELPFRASLDEKPADAWLGGAYMAGAGRFADVRLYWEAVGRYAQIMQARESDLFGAALAAALDGIPLPEADRVAVEARAVAGFAAAEPRRAAVYGQLREVVDASLSLHAFLELNEANIDYEPADAGLSRDPVLEAVPITDALGDEMWNRVAAITSALDALGYLDQVTTQGLLDVFFEKLAAVPVE